MVSGQCRYLQMRDPRKVKIVYENPRWHELWKGNPRIAHPGERGDFQTLVPRIGYRRPYIAEKSETRWTWQRWGPEWGGAAPVGEIYLTDAEKGFGIVNTSGVIVISPTLKKGASPNKAWGDERWKALVAMLSRDGHRVVQLGPHGTKIISGATPVFTNTIREAVSAMMTAKAAILTEGALHHIAAAVGTPAVVIFGAYISPEVTGYASQTSLFTGEGLGCGMRVPCYHCAAAMQKITPEAVLESAQECWTSLTTQDGSMRVRARSYKQ